MSTAALGKIKLETGKKGTTKKSTETNLNTRKYHPTPGPSCLVAKHIYSKTSSPSGLKGPHKKIHREKDGDTAPAGALSPNVMLGLGHRSHKSLDSTHQAQQDNCNANETANVRPAPNQWNGIVSIVCQQRPGQELKPDTQQLRKEIFQNSTNRVRA